MHKKHASRAGQLGKSPRRALRKASKQNRGSGSASSAEARLLYAMADGLEIGVANVSPDGTILYANRYFVEMLQANPLEMVIGARLNKFVSAASWTSMDKALKLGLNSRVHGEMKIASHSDQRRTLRLSLMPVRIHGKSSVMITATEVTELVDKSKALRASEESLHTLSARILQLQDQERRRIARDLHDITGQELAVVVMSLNQVANNLNNPSVNARQILDDSVGLVRKVEDEVRTLSYLLHPPLLDEFGLRSALSWYAEGFTKRSGIEVTLEVPRDLPRLCTEKETALFRVVQESLTNVLRHSHSSKACIRVEMRTGDIRLSVEDAGKGISSEALAKIAEGTASGVGTLGMRERIQQLGGTLRFRARARGTQVIASVPVTPGEIAAAGTEASQPDAIAHDGFTEPFLSSAATKRILIADDHDVTRQGIRTLLQTEPNVEVCGEAQDGLDAVAKARELNPDLIIMDISMPGASGFSAASNLRSAGSRCKILFFTTHTYGEIERMSRQLGFEGLVTKTNAARDLLRAVRAILAGNKFFNSEIVRRGSAKIHSESGRRA